MKLHLSKGLNLRLAGAIGNNAATIGTPVTTVAICPDDFPGFTPKPAVRENDKVETGTPLLYDKYNPTLCLVSPVAGTVKAVVRGERRKILRVVVEADGAPAAVKFDAGAESADAVGELLARSGMMALIRRRPYDIVAFPTDTVRDIFVTALDTAPLAYPMDRLPGVADADILAKAVKALKTFTKGDVYISRATRSSIPDIEGAVMVDVDGPHPAGNAGIQAANIKPVNKGETIWCLDVVTLWRIGRLLATGNVDATSIVAVTGPEVTDPVLVRTVVGAPVASLVKGRLADDGRHKRIISGNVLTGTAVGDGADAYLRYPYRQITVIAEGDDVNEFMGWASLNPSKMSTRPSFPGRFLRKLFRPDARLNGGRRSMIMSGEYDRMIPMDILPEYLIKAIMARDIEKMEQLGIYEVAPEDFALAEYADTSKLPLQQIVRDGLDYLRKENE